MKNLSQVRQLSNCFEFTFRKYLVRTGRRVFWCWSFRLATCQTSHLPWFARTKRGVRSILIRYQRWKTFIQAAAQTFGWQWRWRRKPSSPLDPERSGNTYQRERMPAWLQECWLARTAGTMRKQADGGKKKKEKKKHRETELQPVAAVAALCWIHDCKNITCFSSEPTCGKSNTCMPCIAQCSHVGRS